MAVKSGKNTITVERFKAAFLSHIEKSNKKKIEIATELGINTGSLTNLLKRGASTAIMEEIAGKLGYDLLDMLNEGRAILAGEPPEENKPAAPEPMGNAREVELLRKLELANDEARKWRLKAEELEMGFKPTNTIDGLESERDWLRERVEALEGRLAEKEIVEELVARGRAPDVDIPGQ